MYIIPAIDLINGQCVRLTKGDYSCKTVYDSDPVTVAKRFMDWGVRQLHVVDLDGAKAGHPVNLKVVRAICNATREKLDIDCGGGIRDIPDVEHYFDAGANMITAGSMAVFQAMGTLIALMRYKPHRIILGADVLNGHIAVKGWEQSTQFELYHFVNIWHKNGIKKVICTEVGRDGMMQGPALDMYQRLVQEQPDMEIIASGGVSGPDDLKALEQTGVAAVIVGKAIYEGKITDKDLAPYL